MATDTQKYSDQLETDARHSALEEFSRDERRPAVLLLSALIIAVLFFAIGLLVGRWTAEPAAPPRAAPPATPQPANPSATAPASSPTPQAANNAAQNQPTVERRFSLLVATYDAAAKAEPLVRALEAAGYKDIRTSAPRPGDTRTAFSVLVGHFTRDEANEAARRMRATSDPRLKNAKVIESLGQ